MCSGLSLFALPDCIVTYAILCPPMSSILRLLSSVLCLPTSLLCPVCSYPPIDCVSAFTLVYLYLYDSFVLFVRLLACLLEFLSWLVIDVRLTKVRCFVFACLGF